MIKISRNQSGLTMVELILVIVIFGILASVAMRSAVSVSETARIEETKKEMGNIVYAVSGNPTLENNGVRTDFGYVGDVGSLPSNLSYLKNNPGSYSTWHGPYIKTEFEQDPNNYQTDAWGASYSFDGISVTSNGSGASIAKIIAASGSDLLYNNVNGNVYDLDGTPPGATYKDSISIELTIPNGSGSYTTKTATVDFGGYFTFDSIPIGNHSLKLIYTPSDDTLNRFVSVIPKSKSYGEYRLSSNWWYAISGGGGGGGGGGAGNIIYVAGSAETIGGDCHEINFQINNISGSPKALTGMTVEWSSPTSYFKEVKWQGDQIYDDNSPSTGSGETIVFDHSKTIGNGSTMTIAIREFIEGPYSGDNVDMSYVDMTITFSDGSIITFNTGECDD